MKLYKHNQKDAEIEQSLKEVRLIEDERRKEYLEQLRNNNRFKKYVIDGIIRKNLDVLMSLDNIKAGDFEEMGKVVFQAQAARKTLERILADIMD